MSSIEEFELDNVISEIGNFGKFQFINYVLISIPLGFTAAYTLSYVFTASDLSYRCAISECDKLDQLNNVTYNPEWLKYAVPFYDDKPSQCERYQPYINNSESICTDKYFDSSNVEYCNEFIYENDEATILNEV